jgi:predicted nucleic acid-binding protein
MPSPADATHVGLDTSCVVALRCGWHARHADTVRALEEQLDAGMELVLAAHTLVEAYSVLTRLPAPHRVSPEAALDLLRRNFHTGTQVLALTSQEVWSFLDGAPGSGVLGGRAYDALIVASLRKVHGTVLMTLNPRHFEQFADASFEVRTP